MDFALFAIMMLKMVPKHAAYMPMTSELGHKISNAVLDGAQRSAAQFAVASLAAHLAYQLF